MHGPVRAPKDAGAGTATARLSFDAWKEGHIRAAELSIRVVAPRPGSKPEPVSRRLIKTLIHTNRNTLIGTVLFAPDGKWIAGCCLYGTGGIQIWDATTGKQLRNIRFPEGYGSRYDPLPLSPNGRIVYVPIQRERSIRVTKDHTPAIRWEEDGEIQVWDLATSQKLSSLRHTPPRGVLGAALSSDGKWLAAVECRIIDEGRGTKNAIALWDISARQSRDLGDSTKSCVVPRFAPDGKTLAAPFVDGVSKLNGLGLWDVASGKRRTILHSAADYYGTPVFSGDGRYIAVDLIMLRARPPEVKLWEVASGKEVGAFAAPEKTLDFNRLAFSPDGRRLAATTPEDGKVFLYDVPSRQLIWLRDAAKNGELYNPVFSPDGKWLAVPGQQRPEGVHILLKENPLELPQPSVFLFDPAADREPQILIAPHGFVGRAAFSPDSRTLALGGYGCVWLFDIEAAK